MKVYGIPNCDTVKKARTWLESHGIQYEFHDYKKHGVDAVLLAKWMDAVGWQEVVNRRGVTWRKLSDAEKAAITSNESAIRLLMDKPSAIKRPAFEYQDKLVLGFDPDVYQTIFKEQI